MVFAENDVATRRQGRRKQAAAPQIESNPPCLLAAAAEKMQQPRTHATKLLFKSTLLSFLAGHSLTTFEHTISRFASQVRRIVSVRIGSRDIEDSDDSDFCDVTSSHEDADGRQKWKWRRKRRRKRHYPSSSEYESEESEGPDVLSSSEEETTTANNCLNKGRRLRDLFYALLR